MNNNPDGAPDGKKLGTSNRNAYGVIFVLFLSGFAIGWMVGLSASEVLNTTLGAIFAVVIAVVAYFSGVEIEFAEKTKDGIADGAHEKDANAHPKNEHLLHRSKPSNVRLVSSLPLAAITIGISVGATIGVLGRAHRWLGPAPASPKELVKQWVEAGVSQELAAVSLLRQATHGSSDPKSSKDDDHPQPRSVDPYAPVLFSGVTGEFKDQLMNSDDAISLRKAIDRVPHTQMSNNFKEAMKKLIDQIKDDPSAFRLIKEVLCAH